MNYTNWWWWLYTQWKFIGQSYSLKVIAKAVTFKVIVFHKHVLYWEALLVAFVRPGRYKTRGLLGLLLACPLCILYSQRIISIEKLSPYIRQKFSLLIIKQWQQPENFAKNIQLQYRILPKKVQIRLKYFLLAIRNVLYLLERIVHDNSLAVVRKTQNFKAWKNY